MVPYRLSDGTRPVVLHLVDDCSRLFLALQVGRKNTEDIWATFTLAAGHYGLPAQILTDNARAFSGRRLGWTAEFEANLAALHIGAITCRVNHPQTCGR